MSRILIGRTDIVDLPELNLFNIDAKVDTGANTCALHCHHIHMENNDGSGEEVLTFKLLDPSHTEYNNKKFIFKDFAIKSIKNSFGDTEERYIITTVIRIFDQDIVTNFSLTDRQSMKFPILIGRKLLRKRFIVDVGKKNLSHKKIIKKI